jgi:hypothetical protein
MPGASRLSRRSALHVNRMEDLWRLVAAHRLPSPGGLPYG